MRGRSTVRGMSRRGVPTLALCALAISVCSLTGCDVASSGPLAAAPTAATPVPITSPAGPSSPGTVSPIPSKIPSACIDCTNSAGPAEGKVVLQDGVQVLAVTVAGENYSPNNFTVKAGVPVRMTFSGKAIGCFKQPTFKSLGKRLDISSGSGSIDLGPLEPGTYPWASALGICPGTIVAK